MDHDRTTKPGALLLGGAHGSLAVARSLGRHGIPIFFVTNDNQITKLSRYTTASASWAGPNSPDAVKTLLELAERHDLSGYVLFPGGDEEARLVAQNHAALSSVFRVTTPEWETTQWALDKKLTYQRAASLGIHHPWSLYPRGRQDIAQLNCRFPVILKPTARLGANAFTMAKAWQIHNQTDLLDRYDQAVALVGTQGIVLQEMIPGGGTTQFSYAAICDRGQSIASIVARRARQYPINIGYTSTLVRSVDCQEVEEAGSRFLQSLNYTGIAEVEFKYDSRDGCYKILDVNARVWTWNALGGIAGVDFPYILWQQALGKAVTPSRGRSGATWMHFSRDFVAGCEEIAIGRISLFDYLKSFRAPLVFAAFAIDDPLPGIADLPLLVFRIFTSRLPMMLRNLAQSGSKRLFKTWESIFRRPSNHKAL